MHLDSARALGSALRPGMHAIRNRLGPLLMVALIATAAITAHASSADTLSGSALATPELRGLLVDSGPAASAPLVPGVEGPDAACAEAPAGLARVQDLFDAQANARDALITIRRNAQDWKNLLLRGSNAADRQTMQQRFETQASLYEAQLLQLRGQLAPWAAELERMDLLERERVNLFERYRSALATYGVQTLEAAALADRAVQGADVATFRTLEQTVDALTTMTRTQLQTLKQSVARCVGGRSRQL